MISNNTFGNQDKRNYVLVKLDNLKNPLWKSYFSIYPKSYQIRETERYPIVVDLLRTIIEDTIGIYDKIIKDDENNEYEVTKLVATKIHSTAVNMKIAFETRWGNGVNIFEEDKTKNLIGIFTSRYGFRCFIL